MQAPSHCIALAIVLVAVERPPITAGAATTQPVAHAHRSDPRSGSSTPMATRAQDEGQDRTVVLAPPTRMENRGLPKTALAVGTTATVVGYPNRTDAKELRAERITIADKTTELR